MLITVSGSLKKTVSTPSGFWKDDNPYIAHDAGNLYVDLYSLTHVGDGDCFENLTHNQIQVFIDGVQAFINNLNSGDMISGVNKAHLQVMLGAFSSITNCYNKAENLNLDLIIEKYTEYKQINNNFSPDYDYNDCESLAFSQLPNNIQSLIYRFIFEVMNNAVKYSGASHISFKVEKHAEGTALIYIDDGVGFTYEEDGTLFLRSKSGHGLNHLEMTAQQLNVNFTKRNRDKSASGIQLELIIPNMYCSTDETKVNSSLKPS